MQTDSSLVPKYSLLFIYSSCSSLQRHPFAFPSPMFQELPSILFLPWTLLWGTFLASGSRFPRLKFSYMFVNLQSVCTCQVYVVLFVRKYSSLCQYEKNNWKNYKENSLFGSQFWWFQPMMAVAWGLWWGNTLWQNYSLHGQKKREEMSRVPLPPLGTHPPKDLKIPLRPALCKIETPPNNAILGTKALTYRPLGKGELKN